VTGCRLCVMEAVTYGRKKVSVAVKWDKTDDSQTPLRVQHERILRESLRGAGVRIDDLATEYLKFCVELYNCTETIRSGKTAKELQVTGN
jgi:hypothetical protein